MHHMNLNKTGNDSRHSMGNLRKYPLDSKIPKSPKNNIGEGSKDNGSDNIKGKIKSPLK